MEKSCVHLIRQVGRQSIDMALCSLAQGNVYQRLTGESSAHPNEVEPPQSIPVVLQFALEGAFQETSKPLQAFKNQPEVVGLVGQSGISPYCSDLQPSLRGLQICSL